MPCDEGNDRCWQLSPKSPKKMSKRTSRQVRRRPCQGLYQNNDQAGKLKSERRIQTEVTFGTPTSTKDLWDSLFQGLGFRETYFPFQRVRM